MKPVFKYSLKTRLKQKLLQVIVQDSVSEPYLSQAFFRSLADMVITREEDLERASFPECRILYVKSNFLEEYLTKFGSRISPTIIISGSSDTPIDFPISNYLPNSVEKAFVQNSFVSDCKKIFTLPIGVEDLSLALNGLPGLLRDFKMIKENTILVGPFSPNTSERKELLQNSNRSQLVHLVPRQTDPSEYAKLARRFKFIACPAGNGIDTHRVWETLYRGSFPIVKRSAWSESLREMGYPILEVDSWENLDSIVGAFLNVEPPNPANLDAIWSHHWKSTLLENILR